MRLPACLTSISFREFPKLPSPLLILPKSSQILSNPDKFRVKIYCREGYTFKSAEGRGLWGKPGKGANVKLVLLLAVDEGQYCFHGSDG